MIVGNGMVQNLQRAANFDNLLAKVGTLEDIKQSLRSGLDAFRDGFTVSELAFLEQGDDLLKELGFQALMVADNETLDAKSLSNNRNQVANTVLLLSVVLTDHTAGSNATMDVHMVDDMLKGFTTNILKVDIDTIRAGSAELSVHILGLVVKGIIETDGLEKFNLVVATSRTNNVETKFLSKLSNELTDSTRGSRNEESFTLLGLSNLEKAMQDTKQYNEKNVKSVTQLTLLNRREITYPT
jgi:hypothetical protein